MQDVVILVHLLIFESKLTSIVWFNTNVIVNVSLTRMAARKIFQLGFLFLLVIIPLCLQNAAK